MTLRFAAYTSVLGRFSFETRISRDPKPLSSELQSLAPFSSEACHACLTKLHSPRKETSETLVNSYKTPSPTP